MADIINLKQVRKQKKRVEKAKKAQENRIIFGRTLAEKRLQEVQRKQDTRLLDDHRKDKD